MAAPEVRVPPPSAAISSRVTSETVQRAINALLKWRSSKSKTQKPQLLDQDEDFIYLVLTLKKIPPKGRTNAHNILLPHRLLPSTAELCLIIDDRPNSKLTSDAAKKKLKDENIPISKVIKLSKLKSDYKPFEAKRKLCDSFDLFFADRRVIPLLPRLLGKQFFKKKKIPLRVELTQKNWKEQVEKACSSAFLYLRTGTCSVMRVGKASMEGGKIAENVMAAIDGVVESVPKKWAGVRSFHLKLSESLALPLYQVIPDVKLKIEGVKNFGEGVKEEFKEVDKLKIENGGLKKKKKKGRIQEVRYMDGEVDDFEDELDDVEDIEGEKIENDDVGGSAFGGKKRKKGVSVIGEKRLKKSASKEDNLDKPGEKEAKKKRGVGELKDGASKAKSKKNKNKQ